MRNLATVSTVEYEKMGDFVRGLQRGYHEVLSVSVFTLDGKLYAAILHK